MGKLMGGKKPDTRAAEQAQARQAELLAQQDARLKEQEAAAAAAEEERKKREAASTRAKSGRAGGGSLLSGLETGVTPVSDGKRTQLG
jgi:hypothetical protein